MDKIYTSHKNAEEMLKKHNLEENEDLLADMLRKGEQGRVYYKGTVGELVKALRSAVEPQENNISEINSISDCYALGDEVKRLENANVCKPKAQNTALYSHRINSDDHCPCNKSSNLKNQEKDDKKVDVLLRVIDEYAAEIKDLRYRIAVLEAFVLGIC